MRIAYIVPGLGLTREELERRRSILQSLAFRESIIDVLTVSKGPYTIESAVEEEYAAVSYLGMLYEVSDRYDAFIIGCFGDPGLRAARELTRKPVIGPGEASYALASLLARRFAVITPLTTTVSITWNQLDAYGYSSRVYDVVPLEVKVADIQNLRDRLAELIVEKVRNLVGYGKAEALVLGCMSLGFTLVDEVLIKQLGIPVVNPVKASLKLAEILAHLSLTHSRLSYPTPEIAKLRHLIKN